MQKITSKSSAPPLLVLCKALENSGSFTSRLIDVTSAQRGIARTVLLYYCCTAGDVCLLGKAV